MVDTYLDRRFSSPIRGSGIRAKIPEVMALIFTENRLIMPAREFNILTRTRGSIG